MSRAVRWQGVALLAWMFILLGSIPGWTQVTARLEATVEVFDEATAMSDKAIPTDLIAKAECVAIVPGLKKGAFVARLSKY